MEAASLDVFEQLGSGDAGNGTPRIGERLQNV
jgi:hypothetical protein